MGKGFGKATGRDVAASFQLAGSSASWKLAATLLLLAAAAVAARADDPPLKNRPARFSGAVGEFEVTQTAVPTDLRPDETLTLTVKVAAVGSFREPPPRPDLKGLPAVAERFHVEDLPDP